MTGFGRARRILNRREILVELRSVNHRYFEFNSKLPRGFLHLEEKLKLLIKGKISRGKLEAAVSIHNIEGRETEILINPSVAGGYIGTLRSIADEYGLNDDLSLSDVLNISDAFTVNRIEADEDEIWQDVRVVAEEALENFVTMREIEGLKINEDIIKKLLGIQSMVANIEKLSPENVENYRERLFERMREILEDKQIDEQRILMEAAIFAEKTAVDEETMRLRSHFKQFSDILENEDIAGRKLDFLIQEINREVNTIGSKAQEIKITKIIVDLKSEIEKIREQIQNLE
jgi:uncharacterized protein (TIGR00255 family)